MDIVGTFLHESEKQQKKNALKILLVENSWMMSNYSLSDFVAQCLFVNGCHLCDNAVKWINGYCYTNNTGHC